MAVSQNSKKNLILFKKGNIAGKGRPKKLPKLDELLAGVLGTETNGARMVQRKSPENTGSSTDESSAAMTPRSKCPATISKVVRSINERFMTQWNQLVRESGSLNLELEIRFDSPAPGPHRLPRFL